MERDWMGVIRGQRDSKDITDCSVEIKKGRLSWNHNGTV